MRRALRLFGVAIAGAVAFAVLGSSAPSPAPQLPATSQASADSIKRQIVALVSLRAAAGDPAGLVTAAQAYLREYPKNAQVWAMLGTAYVERARLTADPTYFPKAQGALDRSQKLQPQANFDALVGSGTLANARHEFAKARDLGLRAQRLNAYSGAVYAVLGDAYLNLGDLPSAERATQRMLDLDPSVASFTRAANVMEQRGRIKEARRTLRDARDMAVSAADVAFCDQRLGDLAWNAGQPRDALRDYTRALKADPSATPALIGAARARVALGQIGGGLRHYATAVARAPEPRFLLELGELYQSLGRTAEARRQYAVLAAQERLMAGNGVADGLSIGQYEADHGDPASAVRHLRAEWGRRPNAMVADALGWALHKAGQNGEALWFARRADGPGQPNALYAYHHGEIERALGHTSAARATLTRALAINPHFSPLWVPEARKTLAKLR